MPLRRFKRFRVQFRSSFSSSNLVAGEGVVVNLSLGGCRIESSANVSRGTELELRVHLSDQDAPLEIDSARVRWTHASEFGVEFVRMQPAVRERLQGVVTSLEPPPGH